MGWGWALERVGERGCELDLVDGGCLGFRERKIETEEMVNIVLLVNQCSCYGFLGHS
jgi:hypothetical protein